jgi:hypothetical protein
MGLKRRHKVRVLARVWQRVRGYTPWELERMRTAIGQALAGNPEWYTPGQSCPEMEHRVLAFIAAGASVTEVEEWSRERIKQIRDEMAERAERERLCRERVMASKSGV